MALSASAAGTSQCATRGAPRRSPAQAVPYRRGTPTILPPRARRRQQAAPFTQRTVAGPVRQTTAQDGTRTGGPTVVSILWPALGHAGEAPAERMFTAFRWHHHLRSHLGSGGLVPFA